MRPLCKDCIFAKVGWLEKLMIGWRYAKCLSTAVNGSNTMLSPVDGKIDESSWQFCDIARKYDHMCGVEGKHWRGR